MKSKSAPEPAMASGLCPRCDGSGSEDRYLYHKCRACDGSGRLSDRVWSAADDALLRQLVKQGRSATDIAISLTPIRPIVFVRRRMDELNIEDPRDEPRPFVSVRPFGDDRHMFGRLVR